MPNPILVDVTRSGLVESFHRGAIAVARASGALTFSLGDVERPVYPRSALKPVQAVPLVESCAADEFALSSEEIALAAASHSSEPMHTTRIQAWLRRIGCDIDDLHCGAHDVRHEPTRVALAEAGLEPTALHNNCSGKHTGFLTVARRLNAPIAGYHLIDHPVQQRVAGAVRELTGIAGALAWGEDGCTAPNFPLPLAALARAMAQFADPDTRSRRPALARIADGMLKHPELVAGTGRACTERMRQARGRAIVKTGAEGVFVAILPEMGLGVALKIDDGATRAAETAIAAALIGLGAMPDDGAARRLAHAPVWNTRGEPVGERRPAFQVDYSGSAGGV